MSLNGERTEHNWNLPILWHHISQLIFQNNWTSSICVQWGGLKIIGRKNQTGYLLFGLCVPNLLIRSLLSELFCVYYIWRITLISGQKFFKCPPYNRYCASLDTNTFYGNSWKGLPKNSSMKVTKHNIKTGISPNVTVPPYIQKRDHH